MKALLSAALLLLAACATPLPQTPPPGQPAEVRAPAIAPGQTLRYAVHDAYTGIARDPIEYRVTDVRDDTVTMDARQGNQAWTERYTRDWNWREHPMTNLQDFRYDPPYAALPFPLVAGKSWQSYVNATDPRTGRTNRVRIDGTVLGWDRVHVPAGDFDALKVRRYVYAGNAEFFKTEEHIVEYDWYAPSAGLVVRHEASSDHIDMSLNCKSQCNFIRGDWLVMELAARGS